MTMTKADPEREERRRQQKEIADSLKESGALDRCNIDLSACKISCGR